jgi:hypothetical protein
MTKFYEGFESIQVRAAYKKTKEDRRARDENRLKDVRLDILRLEEKIVSVTADLNLKLVKAQARAAKLEEKLK